MTSAAQGDKVQLVAAGVATAGKWRGGMGLLVITAFSGVGAFQMQADDGVWVAVRDFVTGAAIVVGTPANDTTWNFLLPACPIRMSAGGGAMNVWAVGV